MAIKYSLLGAWVCLALGTYLAAAILGFLEKRRAMTVAGWLAFAAAAIAWLLRWYQVGHIPFQNLFEVFLTMGVLSTPLSMFCREKLRVGGESADLLLGALILFPVAFVFHAEPQKLPPPLQCALFAPHVGVYLLAYVILAKAAIQAMRPVPKQPRLRETCNPAEGAYRMVLLGFPFLTLGLLLGSWWGQLAWGDYWSWDPKEMWSLASWLTFAVYLHFHRSYGKKRAILDRTLVLLGGLLILITLTWVNLSSLFSGLHSYAS